MTKARRSTSNTSRGAILDAALRCMMYQAFHYRGYETDEKAMRALARKFPGLSVLQRRNAFAKAARVYQDLTQTVQRRPEKLVDTTRPGFMNGPEVERRLVRLQARHPQFPKRTLDWAMGFAVYYWVLR